MGSDKLYKVFTVNVQDRWEIAISAKTCCRQRRFQYSRSMISAQKKKALQMKILSRYKENARDLPWRRTTDPYKILVSEIMLQQTQVERVKIKYKLWLEHFPTVEKLAAASQTEVLTLRSGLGYNRRGLNLWKAAKQIADMRKLQKDNDYFPSAEKELLALPGVWMYTAHAVMAFGWNAEVPVLDINIKRVLITELWLESGISDKELRSVAQTVIPAGQSRDWHNALMDYWALVLTSKKTWIRSAPQSQFVGSTRRVRGNILKLLIKNWKLKISDAKKQFPHERFDEIVAWMEKEGIVVRERTVLQLAE